MNSYYDLIYLTKELKKRLVSGCFTRINTPYRNVLEFYVDHKDDPFRIIFSTEPNLVCLFTDSYRPPKRGNTISFFEPVYGLNIEDVFLTEFDRYIVVAFEGGWKLVFRMFGNNANAILFNNGEVESAFKNPEREVDQNVPVGKQVQLYQAGEQEADTKSTVIKANPFITRSFISDLIDAHNLDELSKDEVVQFVRRITYSLQESSKFRVLQDGRVTVWDDEILPLETDQEFSAIDDAMRYVFKKISREGRVEKEKKAIEALLQRLKKRNNNALQNLSKASKGLEKAELYERYGHLLMANGHRSEEGVSIEVEDFYDQNKAINIPLQDSLSIIENAERYYERSRNSKTSYEEAKKAIPVIEADQQVLDSLAEELSHIEHYPDLERWVKTHSAILGKHGYKKAKPEETLPFKRLEVEGYEIWIGRNAKSNDKLVQMAHKEDIWMHARGVTGSHALIRNKGSKDLPVNHIIEEVAAYAAFFSKAKGAELVPVIVTKRKYIRKPKGGATGAVKVDKEEVVLVAPKKPGNV